jgi:hypothetical protein
MSLAIWRSHLFGALLALCVGLVGLRAEAQVPSIVHVFNFPNTNQAIPLCNGDFTAFATAGTINVPSSVSFTNASISVGVLARHNNRGDLRIRLVRPGGDTNLVAASSGDTDNHYNVTFTENQDGSRAGLAGPAPLDDGDNDHEAADANFRLPYRRLVSVPAATINAYTGNVANTNWELRVCDDVGPGLNSGSLQSAQLVLRQVNPSPPAQVCSTTASYDWTGGTEDATFNFTVTRDDVRFRELSNSGQAPGDTDTIASFTLRADAGVNVPANSRHYRYRTTAGTGGAIPAPGGGENDIEFADFVLRDSADQPLAVRDFQMSIRDIDTSTPASTTAGFEDIAKMEGFLGASTQPVPVFVSFVNTADTNLAFYGNWLESDALVADNALAPGEATYRFLSPVDRVRVTFGHGDKTREGFLHAVWLSPLSFCAVDYGDAPSTYGTTFAAGGPRHLLGSRLLHLGANPPDGESSGTASTAFDSDDGVGADEDAIVGGTGGIQAYNATSMTCGPVTVGPGQYCLQVSATNNAGTGANLVGWIDWNDNGAFDSNERSEPTLGGSGGSFATPNLASGFSGNVVLVWNVPSVTVPNADAIRLRLSTDPSFVSVSGPASGGYARDGEVEDWQAPPGTLPVTLAEVRVARLDTSRIAVDWTTATETGTLGFQVLQRQADGSIEPLGRDPVASVLGNTTRPQSYLKEFTTSSDAPIYLEEWSVDGMRERFGPYAIGQTLGSKPRLEPAPWAQARLQAATHEDFDRRQRLGRGAGAPSAEIRVTKTGLQQVRASDIAAAGVNLVGQTVAAIKLRHGDRIVPVRALGNPATVGGDTVLEFYGEAVEDSYYTNVRPYHLEVAAGGSAWATEPGTPIAGLSSVRGPATSRLDGNRFYGTASPIGDPWYFDLVARNGASGASQWSIDLPSTAVIAETAQLRIELWGGSAYVEISPDHRYRALINGSPIGEGSFDGISGHVGTFLVPAGLLQPGSNTVRLELLATGRSIDRIHVESVELSFRSEHSARDGVALVDIAQMEGRPEAIFADGIGDPVESPACGSGCEQFVAGGFQSADLVAMQIVDGSPIELVDFEVSAQGGHYTAHVRPGLRFNPNGEPLHYPVLIAERSRAAQPQVVPALHLPHPLQGGNAELLLIVSARFAQSVDALVSARIAEGLTVRVVEVKQIYEHYSGGIVDPDGIRRFVADAHAQLGTRYLLIVGGDTYDYFDRLGLGSISDVPTIYRATHARVNFAPVDSEFGDVDRDGLPEVAVGRLPARTSAELESMLAKVLEATPAGARSVVIAAERSNPAERIVYRDTAESLLATLGPPWQAGASRVYLDDYAATSAGTQAARADFASHVNSGRNLAVFIGHASPSIWSRENLIEAASLPTILTGGSFSPVVAEFGCWGGYFVEPTYTTMNQAWLLPLGKGARAMLASSSLTETASDEAIAKALLPRLAIPGMRLGDALNEAKAEVWSTAPEMTDVILGMSLFGDPTARMTPAAE